MPSTNKSHKHSSSRREKRKTHTNANAIEFVTKKRRREIIAEEDESVIVNIDDDYDDDDNNNVVIECHMKEEMRNSELQKELEKRTKRREGCSDKDIKHKEKVYKYSEKDKKQKGETNRKREDEYHEDRNRDYKYKEERYRDDVGQDHRHNWGRDDIDRKKRSRDHTSESESKNIKDGSHRRTDNLGGSPIYDERVARHKDNKNVRRDDNKNKDETRDYRSRNNQDKHFESMRYMNDAKIDPSLERGMSNSRNADMEVAASHRHHKSSLDCKYYPPTDHHRVSKQEEIKHSDAVQKERARQNLNSNKDISDKICIDDFPAEKRLKSNSQLSLSSTNKSCSNLPPQPPFKSGSDSEEIKRSDVDQKERARQNLNSNRDLSDKICIDDLPAEKRLKSNSQLSLSSTKKTCSHLPPQPPFKAGSDSLHGFDSSKDDIGQLNNWKSVHLPPQPSFKAGSDSLHGFGSSEDDRGQLNYWESVEPYLRRTQANWNNFSNWPYNPFNHVSPPMFNPLMYQSMPPMLGGPPMNMIHATMPYHFNGDGCANWEHGRTEMNNLSLESNVLGVDSQSAGQQNKDPAHGNADEICSRQAGPQSKNGVIDMDCNTPEVMKVTKSSHVSMVEKDDDTLISRFYLSKIDVSKDLTSPEVYDMCKSMLVDLDQASQGPDECDCKILFLKEGTEDDIINGASLFGVVDDSVFKKAMSLYTKQKVSFTAAVDHPDENQENESCDPDCEVKESCNNYDVRNEVDEPGSLLRLTNLSTNDLFEFGSVNISRIHSPH